MGSWHCHLELCGPDEPPNLSGLLPAIKLSGRAMRMEWVPYPQDSPAWPSELAAPWWSLSPSSLLSLSEHLSPSVTSWTTPSPPPPSGKKRRNLRTLTGPGRTTFDPYRAQGGRQATTVRHSPIIQNHCAQKSSENATLGATPGHPPHLGSSDPLLLTQRVREGKKHLLST